MEDDKPINIRKIGGAEILETLNCAAIAERFFNRSRAWFTQRLNNNLVNGKPVSFTPEELFKLRSALRVLSSEIIHFTNLIPNIPTDMSIQVYVVTDATAIQFIEDNDIDSFKEYLAEEEYLDFGDTETRDVSAIEADFAERERALNVLYKHMIVLAKGDAKQLKKIEGEYAKAKHKEEIARKRALGEDVTLTWREQIEEFFAWFDNDILFGFDPKQNQGNK